METSTASSNLIGCDLGAGQNLVRPHPGAFALPPPSKTKHDAGRLAKAREKRIAQAQKLAGRRGCSLLEVVKGDKHMRDLKHIPDWALQHGVQVRWIDATGVRSPAAALAEGPGGQPSAEDEVDPDFV